MARDIEGVVSKVQEVEEEWSGLQGKMRSHTNTHLSRMWDRVRQSHLGRMESSMLVCLGLMFI